MGIYHSIAGPKMDFATADCNFKMLEMRGWLTVGYILIHVLTRTILK
jgi:hypothetical protein